MEIIRGRRLNRDDDLSFLETDPVDGLCRAAGRIRESLCGSNGNLCTIINGRSGHCSEDCKFCAQSAHHTTGCEPSDFLDREAVMEGCRRADSSGIDRFSIVTAGRSLSPADLEYAAGVYRQMHDTYPGIVLCASHGFLDLEGLKKLRRSGVTMYHCNIETSGRYFPKICTTHTFQDKLEQIRLAREAGLTVCSGGILGIGETFEDRVSMALTLSELEVTSIPVNVLLPIPGTPLEDLKPLTREDILRGIAAFRFLNPRAHIRTAAGRNYFDDGGKELFLSGANAAITGDMLTTTGTNIQSDRRMLEEAGYVLRKAVG